MSSASAMVIRASTRQVRAACQAPSRKRYSTASEQVKKSSHLPWIFAATILTAGGTYIAVQPREPSHHDAGHAAEHDEETKDASVLDKLKHQKEARKKDLEAAKAFAPKPERDGNSVQNHSKAAETNEHKLRKGKFSDIEFDNHITSHSSDPGKDFEKIQKKKAES